MRSPLPGIAFSGKAYAGKSTVMGAVRRVLVEAGYTPEHVSFAAAVKDDVRERFGLVKGDPGAREKMLEWSAQRKREEGEDVWVRAARPAFTAARLRGAVPVCDDLRFPYELDALRVRGMYLVRVDAPYLDRARRCRAAGAVDRAILTSQDLSEKALDGEAFDHRVFNTDVCDLDREARLIVARAFAVAILR